VLDLFELSDSLGYIIGSSRTNQNDCQPFKKDPTPCIYYYTVVFVLQHKNHNVSDFKAYRCR
jgi:hypothetical protein